MSFAIYFEPLDTLFFRDSRPFSAGDDTLAETILPLPLTLYGTIGSYILKKNQTNLVAFLGGGEDVILGRYDNTLSKTKMKIKGPFLSRRNQVYVPCPSNLVKINNVFCKNLKPDLNIAPKWDIENVELRPIAFPEGEIEPAVDFITSSEVSDYLTGKDVTPHKIEDDYLYSYERKVGHKLNRNTLTVEEGFLYSAEHLRFKDSLNSRTYVKTELLVFVEGIDASAISDSVTHIGGERRMARIRTDINEDVFPENDDVINKIAETKQFLLYFLTPALFHSGFDREWPEEFAEVGATLVGATVNKPVHVSGWKRSNVSKGVPRPLKRAVPAGSVYFFRISRWDEEKFLRLYRQYNFNKSLSEEYPHAGFGTALIGTW